MVGVQLRAGGSATLPCNMTQSPNQRYLVCAGDAVELCDGQGGLVAAEVAATSKSSAVVRAGCVEMTARIPCLHAAACWPGQRKGTAVRIST